MEIFYRKSELSHKVQLLKSNNSKIAFVPTMGMLHDGHLSLVETAKKHADIVIVSIFVNPKQFNNQNDLLNYPRNIERDIEMLRAANVNYLFAPEVEELYDSAFSITISEKALTGGLCGSTRPGHFDGVCVVIAKLFNLIIPDFAVFGEKDYQQYLVIKRLAANLDFATQIISSPTTREETGLALSSRNTRLSDEERTKIAPKLYLVMQEFAKNLKNNTKNYDYCKNFGVEKLSNYGFTAVDYFALCKCDDLLEHQNGKEIDDLKSYRLFAAAFIGNVRLIDNIAIC